MAGLFTAPQYRYQVEHYNESKTGAFVAASIVLIVVDTLAVALRFLPRRSRKIAYAVDDYVLLASLALTYGLFISILYSLHFGLGKHILRVGIPDAHLAGRALFVAEAIFPVCTALTKASILLLYRRIFTLHTRWFRLSYYAIWVLLICWAFAGFFTTTFQCWPIHVAWTHVGGHCMDMKASLAALAVINTVHNLLILILPIPLIWQLQISMNKRIGICFIFALGCGDIASGIARIIMLTGVDITPGDTGSSLAGPAAGSSGSSSLDFTWNLADVTMVTLTEPCIGILCACLPVMHTLLAPILAGLRSVFSSSRWSSVGGKDSDRSSESGLPDSRSEMSDRQRFVHHSADGSKDEPLALPHAESGGIEVRRDLDAADNYV